MASFLGEIKRRKVFQVAAVYLVVAWLLVQIVATIEGPLRLPDWFDTAVIVLLAVGFPIAIILSWAFDLTSGGIERTERVAPGEARPPETMAATTGLTVNLAAIAALSILIVLVGLYVFWPSDPSSSSKRAVAESQASDSSDDGLEVLPNSVAVLLCDNLSPDPEDAFFAASIHEEILNQLAKIRALTVIARTSVLQYADNTPPIPEIAAELNVQTVMECSVRYAGDAILVTAQLIDPETNSHLWSETYPGDLGNLSALFAMQADIAMNIANAVGAEFSLTEQQKIEELPTSSPAAYSLYLRAISTALVDLSSSITDLDQAISFDPQFALAYGYKAALLVDRGRGRPDVSSDWEAIAQEAAEKALSLDRNLALAHVAIGGIHHTNGRHREAQEAFELAYELAPDDLTVLGALGTLRFDTGQYEEALALGQRAIELDPSGVNFGYHGVGLAHLYLRNYDAAVASFRRQLEIDPGFLGTWVNLSRAEAARGNREVAVRELQVAEQITRENLPAIRVLTMAATYYRADRPDEAARLLDLLTGMGDETQIPSAGWAELYLASGEYDQARLHLEAAVAGRESAGGPQAPGIAGTLNAIKANIYQDPVLEEPEWQDLRARIHALN